MNTFTKYVCLLNYQQCFLCKLFRHKYHHVQTNESSCNTRKVSSKSSCFMCGNTKHETCVNLCKRQPKDAHNMVHYQGPGFSAEGSAKPLEAPTYDFTKTKCEIEKILDRTGWCHMGLLYIRHRLPEIGIFAFFKSVHNLLSFYFQVRTPWALSTPPSTRWRMWMTTMSIRMITWDVYGSP